MAEVGLARRVAPAIILAAAGGVLLYLLPSGADADTGAEDLGATEVPTVAAGSSAAGVASAGASSSPARLGHASSGGSSKHTVRGDNVGFRYGNVQVAVVLDGSTIVDIKTLTAPGGGYQRFTDLAIPTMKARILKAQSTNVAAASGATYTSTAYAKSVQSALDASRH